MDQLICKMQIDIKQEIKKLQFEISRKNQWILWSIFIVSKEGFWYVVVRQAEVYLIL